MWPHLGHLILVGIPALRSLKPRASSRFTPGRPSWEALRGITGFGFDRRFFLSFIAGLSERDGSFVDRRFILLDYLATDHFHDDVLGSAFRIEEEQHALTADGEAAEPRECLP